MTDDIACAGRCGLRSLMIPKIYDLGSLVESFAVLDLTTRFRVDCAHDWTPLECLLSWKVESEGISLWDSM